MPLLPCLLGKVVRDMTGGVEADINEADLVDAHGSGDSKIETNVTSSMLCTEITMGSGYPAKYPRKIMT